MINELLQNIIRLGPTNDEMEMATLTTAYMANIIKLFALACKTGRECRAEELGSLAGDEQIIQTLCNYASQNQRIILSQRVNFFNVF